MELWSDPDSVFAPLIIGTMPDEKGKVSHLGYALRAAMGSVPPVRNVIKAGLRGKLVSVTRKTALRQGEKINPYLVGAQLYETRSLVEKPDTIRQEVVWEVGLMGIPSEAAPSQISSDLSCYALELTHLKVTGNRPQGLLQLALLRNLWVDNLRAREPGLVVFGGMHRFNEVWWQLMESHAQA
jgi:hypothetical protein